MLNGKIEAFFEEFDFLLPVVGWEYWGAIKSARVERVDEKLLDLVGGRITLDYELGSFETQRVIFILAKDGRQITRIGSPDKGGVLRKMVDALSSRPHNEQETVASALGRLETNGKLEEAHFVVYFEPNAGNLVLYKPPKGFTIATWLEELKLRAKAKIQEDVAAIDSEAKPPVVATA